MMHQNAESIIDIPVANRNSYYYAKNASAELIIATQVMWIKFIARYWPWWWFNVGIASPIEEFM